MEEESEEFLITYSEGSIESPRDAEIRAMTFTIAETGSNFTITCSKWDDDFRDLVANGNIEKGYKVLIKIMNGSL